MKKIIDFYLDNCTSGLALIVIGSIPTVFLLLVVVVIDNLSMNPGTVSVIILNVSFVVMLELHRLHKTTTNKERVVGAALFPVILFVISMIIGMATAPHVMLVIITILVTWAVMKVSREYKAKQERDKDD